jgi:hypothetical protein
MREALKNLFGSELILEDGSCYYFTVQPFEMKNALDYVVAVLNEYSFTKKDSIDTYKLYRTKEGNWYDVSEAGSSQNKSLLRDLKVAVQNKETEIKAGL